MLLKNLASMGALNIFKSFIQFAMNLVLARFISPGEYGLVVFTLPFVAFIAMLTDLGLSSTLVRQPGLTSRQAGAVLTLVLSVGSVCAFALAGTSFAIQSATQMAGLQPIMAAMSGIIILSIAATPPRALLERQLRYTLIARIEGSAVVISATLSLAAVTHGVGVWALVFYNGLLQVFRLLAFVWFTRTDFVLNWNWREIVPMLSFGGWVLASNLLFFAARNGDNILIGASMGAAEVGLYGLAYQFFLVPLMTVGWPASSVLLATLSRHRDEPEKLKRIIYATCALTASICFPLMGYFAFGLQYPLNAFMSPNWHAVPGLVTWLAPMGALNSISVYNGVILLATGEARLQFWMSAAGSFITLAIFVISVPFGLLTLVKAFSISGTFVAICFIVVAIRKVDIGILEFINPVLPAFLATAAGLLAAWGTALLGSSPLWSWLLMSAAFAIAVLATYAFLRRRLLSHWHELVSA
jgi:O-antigen/teichoic acid export membrane protein